MSTPLSGSLPYCTGLQFLDRYDVRTVAEALSDNDVPLDVAVVATNAKLLALLMESSGKMEAISLVGGKYTPSDLAALTGNSAQFLSGIVADITAPKVLGRRFLEFPGFRERLDDAEGALTALGKGELIFGLQEIADAGVITDVIETSRDVENRNLATYQARRLFGRRANRNPNTNGSDNSRW